MGLHSPSYTVLYTLDIYNNWSRFLTTTRSYHSQNILAQSPYPDIAQMICPAMHPAVSQGLPGIIYGLIMALQLELLLVGVDLKSSNL